MRKFSLIMPSRNFKEYEVWNDSRSLAKEVYELTKDFPYAERKGLVDQLHRAVVSIPSNIAEGSSRSNSDFARFLEIALGVFTIWAVFHEDLFIAFEDRVIARFRRRKLKVIRGGSQVSKSCYPEKHRA